MVALFHENESASITLREEAEKNLVFADKNQLIRVFNNIIKNAIQAIPDDRAGEIDIRVRNHEHRIVVSVQDNGSGIPEDQKDKVFVPNFTTKSSGMGIGLAMSKNIIESAGGYIWFESEYGEGTTFYVELPIYTGNA